MSSDASCGAQRPSTQAVHTAGVITPRWMGPGAVGHSIHFYWVFPDNCELLVKSVSPVSIIHSSSYSDFCIPLSLSCVVLYSSLYTAVLDVCRTSDKDSVSVCLMLMSQFHYSCDTYDRECSHSSDRKYIEINF